MSKNNPPDDDDAAFQDAMRGVTPLRHDRLEPAARPRGKKKRRVVNEALQPAFHVSDYCDTTPDEYLFFHRGGLQDKRLQKFKRGEMPICARLDLHGQTVQHAAQELAEFLHAVQTDEQQCVLVIHGRGYRSEQGRPVLKAQIKHWLSAAPEVLAYCSAQAKHGGTGAVYVLLKRRDLA